MTISSKLDLLREVEAEHRFGVIIEPPTGVDPFPEAPPGALEAYQLFSRLEGSHLSFRQPAELLSREAWLTRDTNPHCPLGSPVSIGTELVQGPAQIYLDPFDGRVYYIESDYYVLLYKGSFGDSQLEDGLYVEYAPDLVTFVDEFVLGPRYPELIGAGSMTWLDKKGRYRDSWLRLLGAAGLLGAPPTFTEPAERLLLPGPTAYRRHLTTPD
ncbi:hypothetical protein [Actinoplanes awajinensis]|uniref:Uncharacterized protein n=1 Tax=Actinoplanes awajinensis subsp. mycoplanecinus TaxID=135947 RepID=A0A101JN74_9ACTN|nr:hypothetical protein [Actinoplanes awajinensis]KUL30028.1 hypothetical protein ADL15_26020 [Actinoplanes awajinensis subsp. mycoplanecinus]